MDDWAMCGTSCANPGSAACQHVQRRFGAMASAASANSATAPAKALGLDEYKQLVREARRIKTKDHGILRTSRQNRLGLAY